MAFIRKEQPTIEITCTPAELEALRDKMLEAQRKVKLGESCFVDEWLGEKVKIRWFFDHAALSASQFVRMLPADIWPGDIISSKAGAFEVERISFNFANKAYYAITPDGKSVMLNELTEYPVKRGGDFEIMLAKYLQMGDVIRIGGKQSKIMGIRENPTQLEFQLATGTYIFGKEECVQVRVLSEPHQYRTDEAQYIKRGDTLYNPDTQDEHNIIKVEDDKVNVKLHSDRHEIFVFPKNVVVHKRIR